MALKERDLATTTDDLDALWRAVDKVRSTSRSVTLDKAAIIKILVDHSRLCQELYGKPKRPIGEGRIWPL